MLESKLPDDVLEDRRANGPLAPMMELIRQMHDAQIGLQTTQKLLEERLSKYIEGESSEVAAAITKLIKDSFPDGDPDGHRRYHEASIKKAEAQAKLWETARTEIVKYGILGLLGWVSVALFRDVVERFRTWH